MSTITELERMNRAADRAAFDAIKHMLASIEDPRTYAVWLLTGYPMLARAVRDATPGLSRAERGYWIVQDEKARSYLPHQARPGACARAVPVQLRRGRAQVACGRGRRR
jgi:hypothetical protein